MKAIKLEARNMKLFNHEKTRRISTLFLILTFTLLGASCGTPVNSTPLTKANANAVGSKSKLLSLIAESQNYSNDMAPGLGSESDTAVPTPNPDASGGADRDYVDTNVQVEGVDEGDIVKTDGYQIYYAPRYQNRVHIFEVDDEGVIAYQNLLNLEDMYVDALYLLDDYLVVIGYTFTNVASECGINEGDDYACVSWMWWSPTGTVLVFDRLSLDLVYQVETDGNFLDHRMIDNSLFLVAHKYIYSNEEELRPSYTVNDDEIDYINYNDIYYFNDTPVNGMTVLTGIKLDSDPSKITYNASAFLGAGYGYKQVYVSLTDLYISDNNFHYEATSYFQTMTISQFALDVTLAKVEFVAAGIVKGGMLNQFSMDYFNGYLRIATTDQGATWTRSIINTYEWNDYQRFVDNHLYVLKLNKDKDGFDLIGHISEGLGKPLESIKSVRFLGTKAYIVTFLQTDPLYIIDLTNPEKPVITDEIHLPGFDTYQHPWGENRLLGLGYDADENGMIQGMKLTAYNTTSGGALELQTRTLDAQVEDGANSWSYSYAEALWNHKALLVSVKDGLLGFSVESYEYGYSLEPSDDYDNNWYSLYHSYYYLFNIDFTDDEPISEPIIIEHPTNENYYVGVDRAVMIAGFVYTLSDHQVITYEVATKTILDNVLTIPAVK